MTQPGDKPEFAADSGGVSEDDPTTPVVRDRRRIDPETGELRADAGQANAEATDVNAELGDVDGDQAQAPEAVDAAEKLAAQRLEDLQRLQAEFVNFRRRSERDLGAARQAGVADLCEALIPVLDAIELAREHGELEGGPFQSMAENLEATLGKFGWERYGAPGEEFDPRVHEALMHESDEEASATTIKQVLQPGYRVEERVLRAARVAVVGP